jgi:hypothetical protein
MLDVVAMKRTPQKKTQKAFLVATIQLSKPEKLTPESPVT